MITTRAPDGANKLPPTKVPEMADVNSCQLSTVFIFVCLGGGGWVNHPHPPVCNISFGQKSLVTNNPSVHPLSLPVCKMIKANEA